MRKLIAVLNVSLTLAYPVAVYFGLTHLSARGLGLLLMTLLAPGLISKLRDARREDVVSVAKLPLAVFALIASSAVLNDRRLVLALPVLISAAFLWQFATSLRTVPMVERFARLQDPQLGPAQVAYCRSVTKVWCGFFVINGAISAALALFAPLSIWALYTGLLAYLLMGLLGACEYLVRKFRFREYGPGLHDRLIARVFPPASSETFR